MNIKIRILTLIGLGIGLATSFFVLGHLILIKQYETVKIYESNPNLLSLDFIVALFCIGITAGLIVYYLIPMIRRIKGNKKNEEVS